MAYNALLLLLLLPFAVTTVIYFIHSKYSKSSEDAADSQSPQDAATDGHSGICKCPPTWLSNFLTVSVIIKCLPTIFLCVFVLSYIPNHPAKVYPILILVGLVFSCIGDTLLAIHATKNKDIFFFLGLAMFAVGHIMYIIAFGLHSFAFENLVLIVCAPIGILAYIYLLPGLCSLPQAIWIRVLIALATAVYFLLTVVMDWRGISRVTVTNAKWPEWCGCIGVISFSVSDMVLVINKFRHAVPYEKYIIMSTYFLAQLGISLSVVPVGSVFTNDGYA
ncbi:lysoplasmalogenase TMEM86A-like [Amphiura filiformis]|uniref:lysoplasmalogenase TMEM86A-like n=1 Tax=Amphiura filiformis TaxID=82378 RepID=UPI003B2132FD